MPYPPEQSWHWCFCDSSTRNSYHSPSYYNLFFYHHFYFNSVSANSLERPQNLELSSLTSQNHGKAPGSAISWGSPSSLYAGRPELCCFAKGLRSHQEQDWLVLIPSLARATDEGRAANPGLSLRPGPLMVWLQLLHVNRTSPWVEGLEDRRTASMLKIRSKG